MSNYKSELMKTLTGRGFLYQCTDEKALDDLAAKACVTGYIGFDCTAPSLHVGSLVQIMMLRILQKSGGRPIVLLGGGTTKIGDPSDKDKSRPILTPEKIEENKNGIKRVFAKFLDFDSPNAAIMVDNADWLDGLGYIEFLRDIGKHFTINKMIALESVKRRLDNEQPMTFLEFNYTLLQSYDYLELNRRHGCRLQLGGSDQWGNILGGADLTRRLESAEVYGFTTPLITTASGGKMGKTAEGARWLNADESLGKQFTLSSYDYWQFWRNTEDADVGKFLRLFTDLPLDEIANLETLEGADINKAKIRLANEATTLLHGKDAAQNAEATAITTFEKGGHAEGLPTFEISKDEFQHARSTIALLRAAELVKSNGEAKRAIAGGGVRINDERITKDRNHRYAEIPEGMDAFKVQVSRKRIALVKPV